MVQCLTFGTAFRCVTGERAGTFLRVVGSRRVEVGECLKVRRHAIHVAVFNIPFAESAFATRGLGVKADRGEAYVAGLCIALNRCMTFCLRLTMVASQWCNARAVAATPL